jgi:hypothetical protein
MTCGNYPCIANQKTTLQIFISLKSTLWQEFECWTQNLCDEHKISVILTVLIIFWHSPLKSNWYLFSQIMLGFFKNSKQTKTVYLFFSALICYTVIIFFARNGRILPVKFRPKNFGWISFDLGEISPNQQILRLNNGWNSPKSEEIRPKFLRANLNCADSPGSPEKISTVYR